MISSFMYLNKASLSFYNCLRLVNEIGQEKRISQSCYEENSFSFIKMTQQLNLIFLVDLYLHYFLSL